MPTSSRRVEVKEEILGANERLASENHARLEDAGVFSFNLMASPGAGKTSLVERTVEALAGQMRVAVVDGDIATSLDADRAAAAGAAAIQINTGGQCHLDALMLRGALDQLDLKAMDLLIVENVGNLICPTSFPLGTHSSVLVASVPEGDDKPYKYPGSYRGIDVLVVNKIDLLPHVPFQMDRFTQGVEMLNPGVLTFRLSCQTGEGLGAWLNWVRRAVEAQRQKRGRG
jgi:hydrogenase nickel incorporation protein HypB